MQERRAELDRTNAQAALGIGPSELSASGGGMERMLDKLTEKITERLQVEVRRENAQMMQSGSVGAQVERFLERHIATNTCPICFELMSGKEQQPMLLFPCGHTFCAECLRKHMRQQQRQTCPFCRVKIASSAPNVSLQQVLFRTTECL